MEFRQASVLLLITLFAFSSVFVQYVAGDASDEVGIESDLKAEKVGSQTDDSEREAESIAEKGFDEDEQRKISESSEAFQYQAEVTRLMDLIINSLYQNKDIFLRELISNAADALDKIRLTSLTDSDALGETTELDIRISVDTTNRLLHIVDTGIGMTRDDLVNNLGTIARSGTSEFVKAMKDKDDSSLIGQFGVGFYSAFLVADVVTVTTKNNGSDQQLVWQSDASNSFSISEDPRGNTMGRGTRITLHLKEDADELLDLDHLKSIVTKYSEFINYPILLWTSHEEEVPAEEEEAVEQEEEEEDNLEVGEEEDEDEEEEVKVPEMVTVWDWERLNPNKPIWTRSASELTEEDYSSFYKAVSKDHEEPLAHVHFSAEGEYEFKALLYVPSKAPRTLWDPTHQTSSVKLYVKRVFVTDSFTELLPRYLSFLVGVVDSDSFTINVSREVLQNDKSLRIIKKKLTRKAIALFQKLAKDEPEKFDKFYKEFANPIKLGIVEDASNKGRLAKLLRYPSSNSDELTSLQEYVERMKEGQKDIYFLAGEEQEKLENSPLVEKLLKKGYEVLYLTDPIDEYTMQALNTYDELTLKNVAKSGLILDEDEKEEQKETEETFKTLITFLKDTLGSKIEKAVTSTRLITSPATLTSAAFGWTANQERIIKAQALGADDPSAQFMKARKTLEINPKHPIILDLNRRVSEEGFEADEVVLNVVELLYDSAALQAGFEIESHSDFVSSLNRLMKQTLNIDPAAEVELDEPEVEEEIDIVDEPQHDEL